MCPEQPGRWLPDVPTTALLAPASTSGEASEGDTPLLPHQIAAPLTTGNNCALSRNKANTLLAAGDNSSSFLVMMP